MSRYLPLTLLLTLLASSSCETALSAATYYVGKTGNDQNSCLEPARPCLTVGRASQLAKQPGDIVRVAAGDYKERVTITQGGDGKSPITYTGSSGPVCPSVATSDLNSRRARPAPSVTIQGFSVSASYIVVDCFQIVGSNITGESGSGVYIGPKIQAVTVTNNVVEASATPGLPWAGVAMKSGIPQADFASDVTVVRNYIHNTGFGFMIFCRQNCLFENNEVEELKNADSDFTRVFGERITIRGNYFHGNRVADCNGCHSDCFQSYNVGGIDHVARYVVIDANTCFDIHQAVIVRDTTSNEMDSYLSHHTWTVTNNVFGFGPAGSTSTWCGLFDHVGNIVFEHNLCVSTGVVGYFNGSTGVHRYNIHLRTGWKPYASQLAGWLDGRIETTGNLLFRTDGTYVAAQWPGDIVNREPLFVNGDALNFRIHSQSPARNAATGGTIKSDRTGLPRPQERIHDIGPYEYSRRGNIGTR